MLYKEIFFNTTLNNFMKNVIVRARERGNDPTRSIRYPSIVDAGLVRALLHSNYIVSHTRGLNRTKLLQTSASLSLRRRPTPGALF